MEQSSAYKPVILLGTFTLGALLVVAIYSFLGTQSTQPTEQALDQYQTGYDQAIRDATARLEEKGIISKVASQGPNYIGRVAALQPGVVTLSYPSLNPLEDNTLSTTTFNYTDETQVIMYMEKDPDLYATHVSEWETRMRELVRNLQEGSTPAESSSPKSTIPPLTFHLQPTDVSSLAVGQSVTLLASDDKLEGIIIAPTPEMRLNNPQFQRLLQRARESN
jgi:hypothetical protein